MAEESDYAVDNLGAYVTTNAIWTNLGLGVGVDPIPTASLPTPLTASYTGYVTNTSSTWTQITNTFTATGGENKIVIGNFGYSYQSVMVGGVTNSTCSGGSLHHDQSNYYLDDVSLTLFPALTVSVPSQTICLVAGANGSATLTATITNSGATFLWMPGGETTQSIIVSPTSTTIYTVTATIGNCQATGTSTVTVMPPPSLTLLSPVTICSATPTNLYAYNYPPIAGAYLWSTGETTQSISVSPTTTTTYYCTYTTTDGCSATESVVVTVAEPQAPIITGDPSACTTGAEPYYISNYSGANTYYYQITGGILTSTVNANGVFYVTWSSTSGGTILVQYVDENGCSSPPGTFDVTACCNGGTTLPNLGSAGSTNNNQTSGTHLELASQVLNNSSLSNNFGVLFTNTNGTVGTVVFNQTLYINGIFTVDRNFSFADCEIFMGPNAKILVNAGFSFEMVSSHIHAGCDIMWDGIYESGTSSLIHTENSVIEDAICAINSFYGGQYIIQGSVFNKNYKAINVSLSSVPMNVYPYLIYGNVFTCRDIHLDMVGTTNANTVFGHYPANMDANWTPYYSAATLFPPYSGLRSSIGIESWYIYNASGIVIGKPTDDPNIFENLDYGIKAENSNLNVYNNTFININDPGYWLSHTGIYAKAYNNYFNTSPYINIGAANVGSDIYSNQFYNSDFGIFTYGYNTKANYNTFETIGQIGIKVDYSVNAIGKTNEVNHNIMTDVKSGIMCANITNPKGSGSTEVNYNEIHVRNTTAATSNNIEYYGIYAISTTNNSANFKAEVNYIYNAVYGILEYQLKRTKLEENYIYFSTLSSNQYRYGIELLDCNSSIVVGNWIERTIASPPTYGQRHALFGIYLNGCQNNDVYNNTLTRMGTGISAYGYNNNALLHCNHFFTSWFGFDFLPASGATIGDQIPSASTAIPVPVDSHNDWSPNIPNTANNSRRVHGNVSGATRWGYDNFAGANFKPYIPSIYGSITYYQVGTNSCGPNPPLMPAIDWREKNLGKIVRDENIYDTLVDVYKLHDSLYAFKTLKANDTLLSLGGDDDSVYQQFFDFCMNENIEKFEKVNSYIMDSIYTDTTNAENTNNNINSRNTPDENQRIVNSIYITEIKYERDTLHGKYVFTEDERATLESVAYQNPMPGGEAVFQARAMLMIVVNDDEEYTGKMMQINSNADNTNDGFKLYPNPNNGSMVLEYIIESSSTGIFSIYDVSGRLVKQQTLKPENKKEIINAMQLNSGAYYYDVNVDGNKVKADKLIIVK